MNTDTGKIYDASEIEKMKQEMEELTQMEHSDELRMMKEEMRNMVAIQERDMTTKQKANKQVSKYDNRSKLGRKFLSHRRK